MITWLIVLLLVTGYVLFFVGRYRRERAKKQEPRAQPSSQPLPHLLATVMPTAPPEAPLAAPPAMPPASAAVHGTSTPAGPPAGESPTSTGSTVVDLVPGIRLPDDLVPRGDVLERPGARDRVVFVTTETPADVVRDGLHAALEQIGTEVRWDPDGWQALLVHGQHTGWLRVHPSPTGVVPPGTLLAPTVPAHTVCAEFWTDHAV